MEKKWHLAFGGGLLILAVILFWPGGGAGQEELRNGELVASNSEFDFGEINMADGLVEYEYELVNKGTESVKIRRVYTSCMCTEAFIGLVGERETGPYGMPGHGGINRASVEVEPGEKVGVRAVFDPAAHGPAGTGLAYRVIYLETDSLNNPKVELTLKATVR